MFTNEKKENKGKVLKVKYENVICILYIAFAITQLIYHLQLNGFYLQLINEIIIHLMFIFALHYIIKDIRKNNKKDL